jgi:hypothetical protein
VTRVRRFYGAEPLHLLATVVSFAIVAAGVAGWFQAGSDPRGIIIWAVGSGLVFEAILLPLVWLLDRVALGQRSSPLFAVTTDENAAGDGPPRLGPANRAYVRVPALLSALLLIVFAPLIFRADTASFRATTGIAPPDYLARWLLATAAMFLASAVAYAVSRRRTQLEIDRQGSDDPPGDLM